MKMNEATGELATLKYQDYKLSTLTNIAKSINNLKEKTLDVLSSTTPYDSTHSNLVELDKLYVCIKYQRKMRLGKIINKLKTHDGFKKEAAGHIDVAIRPDGKMYIWDGFRRAFMASLVGLEAVPYSRYIHPKNRSEAECERYEALMFKIRNSDNETMKPEEIFRSKIIYQDKEALQFLDFLRDCHLDVEGLNPGPNNKLFGGFVAVETAWKFGHRTTQSMVTASSIIQNVWKTDPSVSGYLLCGVAAFLDANDATVSYDDETIKKAFYDFMNVNPPRKQTDLTRYRLSSKSDESIAYYIAKNVINMNKDELEQIRDELGLDTDDVEVIDSQDE
jgi:hypothetical protein